MKIKYIGPYLHVVSDTGYKFTRHLPVEVDLSTAVKLLKASIDGTSLFAEVVEEKPAPAKIVEEVE